MLQCHHTSFLKTNFPTFPECSCTSFHAAIKPTQLTFFRKTWLAHARARRSSPPWCVSSCGFSVTKCNWRLISFPLHPDWIWDGPAVSLQQLSDKAAISLTAADRYDNAGRLYCALTEGRRTGMTFFCQSAFLFPSFHLFYLFPGLQLL